MRDKRPSTVIHVTIRPPKHKIYPSRKQNEENKHWTPGTSAATQNQSFMSWRSQNFDQSSKVRYSFEESHNY